MNEKAGKGGENRLFLLLVKLQAGLAVKFSREKVKFARGASEVLAKPKLKAELAVKISRFVLSSAVIRVWAWSIGRLSVKRGTKLLKQLIAQMILFGNFENFIYFFRFLKGLSHLARPKKSKNK